VTSPRSTLGNTYEPESIDLAGLRAGTAYLVRLIARKKTDTGVSQTVSSASLVLGER
jgi:hypothetical protein